MPNISFQEKVDRAVMTFYRDVAAKLGGVGELWFTIAEQEITFEWTPRATTKPRDGWRVWRGHVSLEHLFRDGEQMSSLVAGRIRADFERDELERTKRAGAEEA